MSDRPDYARAAVAGLAAGLFAAWVMDRGQAAYTALTTDPAAAPQDEADAPADPTQATADAISNVVRGRPVRPRGKALAGLQVHYALGAGLGVVYALAAERWRGVTAGFGSLFGLGAALVLDETLVPLAGLSKPPQAYPLSSHVYGAVSHLVFGGALEGARRVLRQRS